MTLRRMCSGMACEDCPAEAEEAAGEETAVEDDAVEKVDVVGGTNASWSEGGASVL